MSFHILFALVSPGLDSRTYNQSSTLEMDIRTLNAPPLVPARGLRKAAPVGQTVGEIVKLVTLRNREKTLYSKRRIGKHPKRWWGRGRIPFPFPVSHHSGPT